MTKNLSRPGAERKFKTPIQPGAFPRLPFYDTRLSDFFCTVPSEFVRGRRLQIDYLKNFAPDLARIKWQAYDTNLFRQHQFHTWLLPKRALKKAWRKLTRTPVIERNWEVQFLCREGRQGLERWLLEPGRRLHEFVSRHELQTLIQDFYEDPIGTRGYTVAMLLTFSAWLEHYA
jgi:asparagine synthase (glutamine-hydrolysing)